jgi:hypothetical protein
MGSLTWPDDKQPSIEIENDSANTKSNQVHHVFHPMRFDSDPNIDGYQYISLFHLPTNAED